MTFDASHLSEEPLFYVTPKQPQQPQRPGIQLLASTADAEQRLAICDACEHYRNRFKQCSICNCIMPLKVRFQNTSCPDQRW